MLKRLEVFLQKLAPDGIALAFSGGVDSTLLLAVLGRIRQERPFPLIALTMQTVLQDIRETETAAKLTRKLDVEQKIFTFDPLSFDDIRYNRLTRCYLCKKNIFSLFCDYARANGFKHLLDGTNADDLKTYRPGRKALQELGVISPLAELGFSKHDIRRMSAELGLPTAEKPSIPCLATRFAYNTFLDEKEILRVAEGERIVRKIFSEIGNIRLRVHDRLVRLEVAEEQMPLVLAKHKQLTEALKKLGYSYITLDMEGFRSGSFDAEVKQN